MALPARAFTALYSDGAGVGVCAGAGAGEYHRRDDPDQLGALALLVIVSGSRWVRASLKRQRTAAMAPVFAGP